MASGQAFIYGKATDNLSGRQQRTKMMVDNGNLLSTGVGISEAFFKRLGLKYEKINRRRIGTAGQGLNMTMLGQTKKFTIRLDGISRAFQVSATVIRGFSDDVNLGGGFLQQAATLGKTQLEFHQQGTTLQVGTDTVELVNKVRVTKDGTPIKQAKDPPSKKLEPDHDPKKDGPPIQQEKDPTPPDLEPDASTTVTPKWAVRAQRTCKLPANSLCFIETEDLNVGKTLVEPAQVKSTLCRALPAVYQKTTKVAMLNLGPTITVKA